MDCRVRRAEKTDAEGICEINVASIQALCAGEYTPEQMAARCSGKTADRCRQKMARPGQVTLVAEVADSMGTRLVGFASGQNDWITGLYVHPNHARQGIGGTLLEALEQELRAAGVVEAQLFSTMTAASFYRAHGWNSDAPTTKLVEGIQIACIPMTKRLL